MKHKRVWAVFMMLLVLVSCGLPGGETPTATPALVATVPALSPTPTATATPTPAATVPARPPTLTPTETVVGGGPVSTASPLPPTEVPLCANYELEIEVRVSQSYEGFWAEFGGKGRIPLTADLSQDPPRLTGGGEVPISGSGMAGECALVYSGSFVYTISGEILRDEQGKPKLHLVGQTEGAITATSLNCEVGGGGGAPAPEQWEMEMPYKDGATESRTVTVPGTTAESAWTLDILCSGS